MSELIRRCSPATTRGGSTSWTNSAGCTNWCA